MARKSAGIEVVPPRRDRSTTVPPRRDQVGTAPPRRGGGERVWSQIERSLEQSIASGEARPGERLGTEHELASRYGVNRHTVRQALASLASRGLVRVEHGHGTFVEDLAIDYMLGRRTRFSENVAAAGLEGRHIALENTELKSDSINASQLRNASGTRVLRLKTLGEARGMPVSVAEHFIPARRFAGIGERFAELGSLTRAFAEFGVGDYTRKQSLVTARIPDAQTAMLLRQPATRPVLHVEAVNLDSRGRPIEFLRSDFCGDRVQLVFESGK